MSDPWGHRIVWHCRHTAFTLEPEHDYHGHPHPCPVCSPGEITCGLELFDVHIEQPVPLPPWRGAWWN